jgi:TRAP-type C4-dicarboxylate transport system substrate-binding protein
MRKLIAVLVACALAAPVAAEPTELNFATFVTRKHRVDEQLIAPMEQAYEGLVNGLSKIVVYPEGKLVEGTTPQWEGVLSGKSDFTFSLPAYTPEVHQRTLMFELPGLYNDPVAATEELWDNISFVQQDYTGVKIIALWFNDATVLITRDKPVTTLADIRGMKVRVSSNAHARIVKAWGAAPIFVPLAKAYDALASGEVEAIFIGASAVEAFKFYEPANFITTNLPESVGGMFILMNQARYDSLSDTEKQAIDGFSGREVSLKMAQMYKEDGPRAIELARQNGVQIIELNEFQRKAFEDRFPFTHIKIGE